MRLLLLPLIFGCVLARASTLLPVTEEAEWRSADGVCRGRIESVWCTADPVTGKLSTQAEIAVEESYRGRLPARVTVEYPGGSMGSFGDDRGDSPVLRRGDERLFFLSRTAKGEALELTNGHAGAKRMARHADGELTLDEVVRQRRFKRWQTEPGGEGADLTALGSPVPAAGQDVAANGSPGSITASGLMVDAINSIPARWLAPDRGDPIPYLLDTTVLPLGITQAQALIAVQNAFAAWTAVTGMTFRFDGFQDFQNPASEVLIDDERIRIQLYNAEGVIMDGSTLAIGGRAWTSTMGSLDTIGGGGGQVKGLEFHKVVRGYVVVRHDLAALSDLKTLEETLCHELGHVFGLTHSSESPSESVTVLKEAMMYFLSHQDGRGATLGEYDVPIIQKAQPLDDTPPSNWPRYLWAHTGTAAQTAPGVNELTLSATDRQSAASALTLVSGTSTGSQGSFSFPGSNRVKFTPAMNYNDAHIVNPATGGNYGRALYRHGDGVNCSPWQSVSVVVIRRDTSPANGDGMPDNWMIANFGNKVASAATNTNPDQDFDKDGFTNLQEYRLGTSPISGADRFDATALPGDTVQWRARPWTLYFLESSTDSVNWQWEQTIIPPHVTNFPTSTVNASTTAPRDPLQNRRLLRVRQLQ